MDGNEGQAFSPDRTWPAHLVSSIAAAVLAAPLLVLPTAPAGAGDKKCERLGHREAECPGELLMAGVRDSNVTLGGLRIGPWRSLEEGELEGIADNVSVIIVTNNGAFKVVTQMGDTGDNLITGGSAFILTARMGATVVITGTGWSNPDASP